MKGDNNSTTNVGVRVLIQDTSGNWFASKTEFANTITYAATDFQSRTGGSGSDTYQFLDIAGDTTWYSMANRDESSFAYATVSRETTFSTKDIQSIGFYIRAGSGAVARLDEFTVTSIPEPGTSALLLGGIAGLFSFRRRRSA